MQFHFRIKPRFFVFVLLVFTFAFLITRLVMPKGPSEAIVMQAATSSQVHVDAVIVRDEDVVRSESTARVEFVTPEGNVVYQDEEIAYVYSAGYTETELQKLEEIRQNIQTYHKTLLSNIVDSQLEWLDKTVDERAVNLRTMVQDKSNGNLLNVIAELETAMVTRQEYLRQNKREDTKLTKLYTEEASRLNSIASWRKVLKAERAGVVTFYLDGYEDMLNYSAAGQISAATVRNVLNGHQPIADTRTSGVYKLVQENHWYAVVVQDSGWNPIVGQEYAFQLDSVPDVVYTATVETVQKSNGEVCAALTVNEPLGPLLYYRGGAATLSINLEGLSVPVNALTISAGQTGVYVFNGMSTTFVPVDVLEQDRNNALVKPQDEGALALGMRVIVK